MLLPKEELRAGMLPMLYTWTSDGHKSGKSSSVIILRNIVKLEHVMV